MKTFRSLFFYFFVLFTSLINAQEWISLTKGIPSQPEINILENNETNTTFQVDISGFYKDDVRVNDKTYQTLDLLTGTTINRIGAPNLSKIATIIAVPDDASISAEIIEEGDIHYFKNMEILPSRKSWFEGAEETDYLKDEKVYQTDAFYPLSQTAIDKPVIFRDFRIINVSVYPLQYNPVTKVLKVVSSFKIKLNYTYDGKAVNIKTTDKKPIAPSFDKIYKSTISNYKEIRGSLTTGHDLMLCIVPDFLYEDFLPYAEWKRNSGTDIRVTKFSDIGATASNPITIKNHIADAYHNWDIPPTYVLLVGDNGVFPVKQVVLPEDSVTSDNYFVEIDGDDYIPELMVGRFTNQGNYRMKVMINKFTLYEKEPFTEDLDWFRKGICCSNDAYESQVTTKEYTRELMLNDGNFLSVDAMMSDSTSGCSYDEYDVINTLNEGRSFLNYRGEGWTTGWWASCTPLSTETLSSLNNGRKHPFFTSIGCGVAMFDAGISCFGEELIQMGTISNPKGAIAFIGPTGNTHTAYNNNLDKGIYKGMFKEDMDTPGQALVRGKLYVYNVFGASDPGVEYEYEIFLLLGDPSIHIWKDTPLEVDVSHSSTAYVGTNSFPVHVVFHDSGAPVENAQVTITGNNNLFFTGYTDASGDVSLSIDVPEDQTLKVTVRGGNVVPYQGNITASGTSGVSDIQTNSMSLKGTPNPFSIENGVSLSYNLRKDGLVSVAIYNIKGQLVKVLLKQEHQAQGEHQLKWVTTSTNKTSVEPGVYICKVTINTTTETIKLVVDN